MSDLKEKIITINEPTNLEPDSNKPINLKDENGDRYILWKSSSKGVSMAHSAFSKLPASGAGQTVGIVYKEEPNNYVNQQGKEINSINRTIVMIKDPSEIKPENQVPNVPANNVNPIESALKEAVQPVVRPEVKEEVDWDSVNFGKCKTLFLVEAFKILGNKLDPTNQETKLDFNKIERDAEQWATMSMRKLEVPTGTLTPDPNDFAVPEEEIKVEENPFN